MKRLLTVVIVGLVVLVSGCAGIPNSSSPQAIGTVDKPAPPNLPKPAPGMDPDVLLREFLKATADPANRHLAARQFLTESASSAWDDAGSALLLDRVVFVETRGSDRVSVSMRADILGSLSDMGVFETGRGRYPIPVPSNSSRPRAAGASTGCPTAFSSTGNSSSRPTSATPSTSSIRPEPPSCPIRATSRSPIPTSWPPN